MSKLADMAMVIQELRDAAAAIDDAANWLSQQFSSAVPTEPEPKPAPGGAGGEIPCRSHGGYPGAPPEVRSRKALAGRPAVL